MSCYEPLRPTISDILSRTLKERTSFVIASKDPQHRALGEEAIVAAWVGEKCHDVDVFIACAVLSNLLDFAPFSSTR